MKGFLLGLALVLSWGLTGSAAASTFTVINTTDADVGSLRWAIDQANGSPPGPHRIVFAIPGSGVKTITLLSNLPEITSTVAIDGTTQPQYNQTPLIEVTGGLSNYPIVFSGAHSSVKGIAFNSFNDNCLFISADVCTVSSCFIGTNPAGTATAPNSNTAIYVTAKRALIGGYTPPLRNVISGNAVGVWLSSTAGQDTVIGNYIGTDVTGTVALSNEYGIQSQAPGIVIEGNLISGNHIDGIYTECEPLSVAPGDGTRITRNLVGTDISGMKKLGNGQNGIRVGCDYSVVGGVNKGNVVSGNQQGIWVEGDLSSYNEIRGNRIGVSADGTLPLGNGSLGIFLVRSHNNVIGGSRTDGTGNLIGANGTNGIAIFGLAATDNTIQGNAIGTSFNGALFLGNTDAGIRNESDRTTIGGLGPLGNIIAHNYGGVLVDGVQSPIRGNSIFDNSEGLGINLDLATSVSPNDTLDADEGSNHLQNFPMIAAVSQVGSQVRLQGHLSSAPSHTFAVDFYSNRACSPGGYGEGEVWLGSTNVTTNGTGLGLFDVQYPLSSTGGGYIFTSTATDDAGSTSEFSPCAPLGLVPTAAEPGPGVVFALGASTPSPSRVSTSLPFTLAVPSRVSLRAYDVSGRLVATLVEGDRPAGPHRAAWSVEGVPAGTYFCKLQARANDGSGQHFEASRTVVVVH